MEPLKINNLNKIKKLKWCFKIKDGIKIVNSNVRLSKSYLEQAKLSLLRANKNFEDKDLLWTTVAIYYSEYYALYSFLQRIGIKCENHSCSIIVAEILLGKDKIKIITKHKERRIDAQYYMELGSEEEIKTMLSETQEFISYFDELVSNLSEKDINIHKETISKFIS